MTKISLRSTSIACLVIWLAIWVLFLLMRFSPFNFTTIPGAGIILLSTLAIALLAPIVAAGLAAAALIRQPRLPLNWLVLGCAFAALFGQALLFLITRWM